MHVLGPNQPGLPANIMTPQVPLLKVSNWALLLIGDRAAPALSKSQGTWVLLLLLIRVRALNLPKGRSRPLVTWTLAEGQAGTRVLH